MSNQEIIAAGEATRFGQADGADPSEAAKKAAPWSVRNSIRRFGLMDNETLQEAMQDPRRTQLELIAIQKLLVARKGNIMAAQQIEDSVDGKLVEKKVEVKTDSYAAMVKEAAELAKARYDPNTQG